MAPRTLRKKPGVAVSWARRRRSWKSARSKTSRRRDRDLTWSCSRSRSSISCLSRSSRIVRDQVRMPVSARVRAAHRASHRSMASAGSRPSYTSRPRSKSSRTTQTEAAGSRPAVNCSASEAVARQGSLRIIHPRKRSRVRGAGGRWRMASGSTGTTTPVPPTCRRKPPAPPAARRAGPARRCGPAAARGCGRPCAPSRGGG